MTINIEITDTPDLLALADIHQSSFPAGWSAEDISHLLAIEDTYAFVAEDAFGLLRLIADEAEILTLAVKPEKRGKGMAFAIVQAMREWLKKNNAVAVFLEVRASNEAALALYCKAGFAEISRRKDYYANADGSSESAIVMRCNIR